jgi:hypothetical protein
LNIKAFVLADRQARAKLQALIAGHRSDDAMRQLEPLFATACGTVGISPAVHQRLRDEIRRLPAERHVAALINATAMMMAQAEVTVTVPVG